MRSGICIFLIISILLIGCTSNKTNNNIGKQINNKEIENKNIKELDKENINNKNIVDIEQTVADICSDKIGKRMIDDDGNKKATEYIEKVFQSLNLEYVFENTYLNNFDFKDIEIGGKERIINISNVVGKINGSNKKNAIVITAHFDAYEKSVLDNASGVGTVLKIAENIKHDLKNNSLKQDLIFCMTNAEMKGFIGSQNFINDINGKYEKIYNVNIDCIGLKEGGPLALKNISKIEASENLYSSIKDVLNKNNIEFVDDISSKKVKKLLEAGYGISDYISFEEKNYPNIHIAQSNMGSLNDRVKEGVETLDYTYLNELAKAISIWIQDFEIK